MREDPSIPPVILTDGVLHLEITKYDRHMIDKACVIIQMWPAEYRWLQLERQYDNDTEVI